MTRPTVHGCVPQVAEENEVGQTASARPVKGRRVRGLLRQAADRRPVPQHGPVTGQTLGDLRKTGALGPERPGVTHQAAQLQSRVPFVGERNRFGGRGDGYGSEKATKASE